MAPLIASKRLAWVLLAVAFHMLLFEMGPGGADGWSYYAITESIWVDGDLDLANNDYGVSTFHVVNGRAITKYPPGTSLLDGPFLLAARVLEPLAAGWNPDFGERGKRVPYDRVDGRVFVRILAVTLAHNLFVLVGLVLLYRSLRSLGFPDGAVCGALCLTFFASPMLFYASNGMSEAPSFLVASLFVWIVTQSMTPPHPAHWALLGLVTGSGVLVHYRNGLLLLTALGLAAWGAGSPWAALKNIGRVVAGAGLILWILPVYNHIQMGSVFSIYPDEKLHNPLRYGAPCNVWFSDQHGLFLFHPAYLLAVAGLWVLLRARAEGQGVDSSCETTKTVAWIAAGIFVLHSVICGSHPEWAGPGAFSHHYLTPVFPLLAVGFAAWITRFPGRGSRTFLTAGALWTYALFLLSMGRLVYDPDGSGLGLAIADYARIVDERIPLPEIARRIMESSHVLRAVF